MITVKEIARLAGVSRGTVDRALHGREGVNPVVAERVRSIAAQHGYVPDRAGRALSFRRNPLYIGVVLHAGSNPFFEAVIEGMKRAEEEYSDFSIRLLLQEAKGYIAAEQLRCIDELEAGGIQALILAPVNDPEVARRIGRLTERGIPVICVNTDIADSKRAVYVGCDYHQSGAVAAGLALLMTGRELAAGVVIGSLKMLGHTQRVHGFASQLKESGRVKAVDVAEHGDSDARSREVVSGMLREFEPDLLYFAAGGVQGGLEAVAQFETQTGKRPKIIACDETPATAKALREGVIQALVTQQPFEQGYTAVRTAFNLVVNHTTIDSDTVFMRNEIKICQNI